MTLDHLDTAERTRALAVDVLPDLAGRRERRARRAAARQPAAIAVLDAPSALPLAQLVPTQAPAPLLESAPAPALLPMIDRAALLAQLQESLPATQPLALVQLGLDNFRNLAASVGAATAAEALERTGGLLAGCLAPHAVAPVGGDCFAVLLPFEGTAALSSQVARALRVIAGADLSNTGLGVRASLSAGVTVLDRPGLTPEGVLAEADLAMAAAKAAGRNRLALHDAMAASSATATHEWAGRLRTALEQDAFVLLAQPVRSLRRTPDQWELLVRLPAGDGELMPPNQFLPVAERFGLMQPVDEWVTRTAVQVIADARQPLRLEVNIGRSTLASETFVSTVESLLSTSGIDPSSLVFEVQGSTATADLDLVRLFSQRLHELGCLFALDGFGHSGGALEQLKVLPLDYVKIDGSFVRHLATSTVDQRIVGGLTQIAHDLSCQVIAMAVSDDESRSILDSLGVDFVQGFHIGRPQPLVQA